MLLKFDLRADDSCFRGHFEAAPVLAGVIQVGWAMTLSEQKFQSAWQFRGLQSVKFQRLILPPVSLQLELEHLPARQLLRFTYSDEGGVYSSGAIRVDSASDAPDDLASSKELPDD